MADRTPVLMAAFAVAMSARFGLVRAEAVDWMRTQAEELLPEGDSLRAAVILFATQWLVHQCDAQAMIALGETLEQAVERAARPAPVDLHRVDIHG